VRRGEESESVGREHESGGGVSSREGATSSASTGAASMPGPLAAAVMALLDVCVGCWEIQVPTQLVCSAIAALEPSGVATQKAVLEMLRILNYQLRESDSPAAPPAPTAAFPADACPASAGIGVGASAGGNSSERGDAREAAGGGGAASTRGVRDEVDAVSEHACFGAMKGGILLRWLQEVRLVPWRSFAVRHGCEVSAHAVCEARGASEAGALAGAGGGASVISKGKEAMFPDSLGGDGAVDNGAGHGVPALDVDALLCARIGRTRSMVEMRTVLCECGGEGEYRFIAWLGMQVSWRSGSGLRAQDLEGSGLRVRRIVRGLGSGVEM
jgi:hypothetical protein